MEKIRTLLRSQLDAGVTKMELAHRIGVPASSIFGYMYGTEPSNKSIRKIAAFFNVDPREFLSDEAMPPPSLSPDEVELLDRYRQCKAKAPQYAQAIILQLRYVWPTLPEIRAEAAHGTNNEDGEPGQTTTNHTRRPKAS